MERRSNGVLETRLENSHACRIPTARSPQPSPSGRGSTVHQTRSISTRTVCSRDERQLSLSLRERVGVRGNRPCLRQAVQILEQPLHHWSIGALECCTTSFQLGGA